MAVVPLDHFQARAGQPLARPAARSFRRDCASISRPPRQGVARPAATAASARICARTRLYVADAIEEPSHRLAFRRQGLRRRSATGLCRLAPFHRCGARRFAAAETPGIEPARTIDRQTGPYSPPRRLDSRSLGYYLVARSI